MELIYRILLILIFATQAVFAAENPKTQKVDLTDYLNIITLIKNEPLGANFLKPISVDEKKQLIAIFNNDKNKGLFEEQKKKFAGNDDVNLFLGHIDADWTVYKGDLHNDGSLVYEIIQTVDTNVFTYKVAYFYQLKDNHLILLNFNHLAHKQFGDSKNFGMTLAPFMKDGKTYLRFLPEIYPIMYYDLNYIALGIYFWQGDSIAKSEPHLNGNDFLSTVKPCGTLALKATKKKFQQLYDAKHYSEAYSVLNSYVSGCKFYYSDDGSLDLYDLLRIQNNLLITLIHLNDKKQCTALMSEMKSNSEFPRANKPFIAALQFNFDKCENLKIS